MLIQRFCFGYEMYILYSHKAYVPTTYVLFCFGFEKKKRFQGHRLYATLALRRFALVIWPGPVHTRWKAKG